MSTPFNQIQQFLKNSHDAEITPELKQKLLSEKHELTRPEATTKAQYLAFIDKSWLKSYFLWLNGKTEITPGPIPNHLLCFEGKFDTSKEYGIDFLAIPVKNFDELLSIFHGGPKIVRPYVIHPGSGNPCFIYEPIQIECDVEGHIYKKVVDERWLVSHIKKALCTSLNLSKSKCQFLTHDCRLDDGQTKLKFIDQNCDIGTAICQNPGPLRLYLMPGAHILSSHVTGQRYENMILLKDGEARGLINDDATSFVNASLQALFHLKPLSSMILSQDFEKMISTSKGLVCRAMKYLFNELSQKNSTPANKQPLLSAIRIEKSMDAIFFIECLVNTLISETNLGKNHAISPLSDIFVGHLSGAIECEECHNFSIVHSTYTVLGLPIPKPGYGDSKTLIDGVVPLDECIAKFSLPTKIPTVEAKPCSNCHKSSKQYRTLAIETAPNVLLIALKRFSSAFAFTIKNDTPVGYPDQINIASFVGKGSGIYSLVSVIYHEGDIEDGIFTTTSKEDNGHWFYYVDEKVYDIGENPPHKNDAVLLCYIKQ